MKKSMPWIVILFLASTWSLQARFASPVEPQKDCKTSEAGSRPGWDIQCRCLQGGLVLGGMIIVDNIVWCDLNFGDGPDKCNYHANCYGYILGPDVAEIEHDKEEGD